MAAGKSPAVIATEAGTAARQARLEAGMSPQEAAVAATSAAGKEVTSGAIDAGDLLTSIAAIAA